MRIIVGEGMARMIDAVYATRCRLFQTRSTP